jgi:hypothetical protein
MDRLASRGKNGNWDIPLSVAASVPVTSGDDMEVPDMST